MFSAAPAIDSPDGLSPHRGLQEKACGGGKQEKSSWVHTVAIFKQIGRVQFPILGHISHYKKGPWARLPQATPNVASPPNLECIGTEQVRSATCCSGQLR
ncbi:hypothetical protein AALO_G00128370 [Alosa alosa]|uniref:Uncharacterized protein n=1 Tax=Alosa alosa TaxID=278164 RepID=A0AAV6GNY0_9TELE|nr:hypothetical protein AALO_G00128370 [Alosa alosa]